MKCVTVLLGILQNRRFPTRVQKTFHSMLESRSSTEVLYQNQVVILQIRLLTWQWYYILSVVIMLETTKKCGDLISASGSDSFTSCFDFLHCLLNLSIMDSSTIFQALPQAAYFLWSCDKVYHKQEICFLLYMRIVSWQYNPIGLKMTMYSYKWLWQWWASNDNKTEAYCHWGLKWHSCIFRIQSSL